MPADVTAPTEQSVSDFIAAIDKPARRADAQALDAIFRDVTGWEGRMWGPSMVGYGAYDYAYASGRTGRSLATGFSPRAANMVVYIMPGYTDFPDITARLGKHKLGKSCLYFTRLSDIDEGALRDLIAAGLGDLATRWPVSPL